MTTQRLMRLSLFSAAALIMGLIENMLPPLLAFAPGVKMGLTNIITLTALIVLGAKDAYIILLVRCLLGSVFGGNISALMYSLPAGLTSLTIQLILYRYVFPKISLVAISLIGAIIHNLTQLIIASLIVWLNLMAVLPLTIIASVIAGIFVGLSTYFIIKYLPKNIYIQTERL